MLDVQPFIKISKFPINKLPFVVSYNGMRYSKSADDIFLNEVFDLFCSDGSQWLCLDPLSEIVHSYK